ncbi:MAG: alpha-amylase family glycosyl hydrolase [Actinomycetota bacterium]
MPEDPAWWQRGVVYQIYPRSFFDTSGDGVGDLAGIRARVDYLDWLGIDAVWLSPIFPSPDADLGYDISDYRDVHPAFGSLSDLDDLIAVLHERGIRLVLDLVPNHTSDRHPWFLESRSADTARHDWYVWREGHADGSPPNNWVSYFGGPAWDYLDPPGKWYLHSFAPGQPDLNWDNPDVRAAIHDVMRFWLDRGVDGFRVDVLWLLGKDPELRDNPADPDWHQGLPSRLRFHRAHSEDGPDAHERARSLRAVVDEYPDRVMIAEVVLPPNRAVAYHGEALDEAHLPHNFALTEIPEWSAKTVRAVVEEYEALLPPGAWPNWLLGDHDFPRFASRVGADRVRVIHMLLLTLRGTPTWYYGDELGMPDAVIPASREGVKDPQAAEGPGLDRMPVRTPMQWAVAPHAGFSDVEPWLPIASDDPELTVERQRADPGSVLSHFRALVGLRKELPALAVGAYRSLPAPSDVFSFERRHPDGQVQVHLNFGGHPRDVELPPSGEVLLSTAGEARADGAHLTLRGYEGVIVAER